MDAALEAKLKTYVRLGTFLVELPGVSKAEGAPCVAQLRRMKGQDFSHYLREQNRLSFHINKLRQTKLEQAQADTQEGGEAGTVAGGMSEAEEKYVFQIVASMRALLQPAVLRVFIDHADGLQAYKVVTAPPGDHAENEVSIDYLEPEYSLLVNRMLVKSGLIPDEPFPASPPDGPVDAGRSGETVQPAAEPAGERVVSGSAA